MNSNVVRYVPKLNDRDVIRAFESVASDFVEQQAAITFQDRLGEPASDDIEKYKALTGYFLKNVTLTVGTLTAGMCNWQWARLPADPNNKHSAYHDTLTFSWDSGKGRPDRLLVAFVTSALDTALSRPLASAGEIDTGTEHQTHNEILLAMESTAARVLTDATNHRHALENAYLQKEEALTARVDNLRERELARISEEKIRIDDELVARKSALDERQRSLDSLQKTLDDRNNTHVRREIRSSLMQLTKERLANFAVSKETRTQYMAVHAVSLFGFSVLAAASIWYGSKIAVDPITLKYPSETIALAIKSGTFAAAAITLGSWYLGWLNRWLQRIADAEFKLQQFRLDIERASWLAETVLEWKATSSEPFPELLTSRLSTGLFHSSSTDVDDPKTPASHLAEALFGAASSAKLKLGDQEVSLDRRAIKDLNK